MDLQASCFALYLFCMTNDLSMIENFFYDLLLSMFFICEYCVFLVFYFARKFLKLGCSRSKPSIQLSFNQHLKRNNCRDIIRQFLLDNCLNAVSYFHQCSQQANDFGVFKQFCVAKIERGLITKVCLFVLTLHGDCIGFQAKIIWFISSLSIHKRTQQQLQVHEVVLASVRNSVYRCNILQSLKYKIILPEIASPCTLKYRSTYAITLSPPCLKYRQLPAITPVITNYIHHVVPIVKIPPLITVSSQSESEQVCINSTNKSKVSKESHVKSNNSTFKVCNVLKGLRKQLPSVVTSTKTSKKNSADTPKSFEKSRDKSFKCCDVFKRFRQQECTSVKSQSSQEQENLKDVSNEFNQLLSFINQTPLSCDNPSQYGSVKNSYMDKVLAVVNQPQFGGTLSPEMLAYPLLEHLEFKTYLGGGAFGRVYKTVEVANSEIITLKVVQNSVESDEEVAFMQELCGHPNIVEITWTYHSSQFTYIAMKNHGEQIMSLSKYVANAPQVNEDMLSIIGRQVAAGLSFINTMGIAHLDLKEDNCIINENLEIRIIDFGLSMRCRVPHIEQPHYRYGGTLNYMSPECINETGYYGPEVDSWSFGVMLYTIFTGDFPFTFNDRGQLDLPFYRKFPKPNRAMSNDLSDLLGDIFELNIFQRIIPQEIVLHRFLTKRVYLDEEYLMPFF